MALPNPGMTFTPFDVLPASELNDLVENIESLADGSGFDSGATFPFSGAWANWSPTYTNITVGSGTVVAKYKQIGKTVFFRFKFTYGSGSAVGAAPTITFPVAPLSGGLRDIVGQGMYDDDNGSDYAGPIRGGATTMTPYFADSNSVLAALSSTLPFTWDTNDGLSMFGQYEAA